MIGQLSSAACPAIIILSVHSGRGKRFLDLFEDRTANSTNLTS